MGKRKPYAERTELEKVQSQWRKTSGLHTKSEWSAGVIRAATAAELAANFVVRKRLVSDRGLELSFVDSLLRWANGLDGKIQRIIIPLSAGTDETKRHKELHSLARRVHEQRNAIVHQGIFLNEAKAKVVIADARALIEGLIGPHEPEFRLKDKDHESD